jgi:hypothetical protein
VSGPDGEVIRQEFGPGSNPSFNVVSEKGGRRADGQYTYELRLVPIVSASAADALKQARDRGSDSATEKRLRESGLLPSQELVQSGTFRVLNGMIVAGDAPEPSSRQPVFKNSGNIFGAPSLSTDAVPSPNDVVTADDQIVQGSLCVGIDCVNNESFGFDTIRLKENNTRIKFEDTSTSPGFAANSWQLTANDNVSGGLNKFSIDDITSLKTPFTIVAGAPTNSVFVDSIGRLGLRTATPVLDIHAVTGNTPAMRLEQTGAGGFTPQTWDIAGNEANFFVRDTTGGSRLPFRIRPGAPTSSIDISATGNVGVGTASPASKLDIVVSNPQAGGSALSVSTNDGSVPSALLTVNNDGNVGIGTSSPQGKLDVQGDTYITGNVFISGYILQSIPPPGAKPVRGTSQAMTAVAIEPQQQMQEKDARIKRLEEQNAELQAQMDELAKRLRALEVRANAKGSK